MKVKVINKGYTIKVVSWENDGDNYKTKFKTVETKEELQKIIKICNEFFEVVGNTSDGEENDFIKEYIENNKDLFENIENKHDYLIQLSWDLMGSSEYYDFRAIDSIEITYSPEDIYLEKIEL